MGADLLATGRAETLVTRADPLSQGFTATGTPWTTDGKLQAEVAVAFGIDEAALTEVCFDSLGASEGADLLRPAF